MSDAQFLVHSIDLENPPPGVRLELGPIAAALQVTVAEMAAAAGISKTALFNLMSSNEWPVRTDAQATRTALHKLLAERGATPEQLRILFHAHVASRRHPSRTDYKNRDVPYRPHGATAPRLAPPEPEPKETDMLLPKQTLGLAARKAFRTLVNPFDGEVLDDSQMFTSGEIAYVREACLQAATGGRFVAVVGESGAGKTTIQADLESRIDRDRKQVVVIKPSVVGMEDTDAKGKALKSTDILAAIITALDPLATMPQTMQARTTRVAKLLTANVEVGLQHLLVIEEAHCLPEATLKHLKRLNELRLGRRPLLGILLLAQPELMTKLDPRKANLREVTQRCEIVQLLPLDGDLKPYLEHRARSVGRELDEFIDASGLEEIRTRLITNKEVGGKSRKVSLLYPLAVNNLVTAALNAAAEIGVPVVNRDVVRAV